MKRLIASPGFPQEIEDPHNNQKKEGKKLMGFIRNNKGPCGSVRFYHFFSPTEGLSSSISSGSSMSK